ncbi:hypothetical protein GCM10022214_17350 [Actinomadura miaoliensis]|uniref:Uncharacterized protein n=1 Tax=Actinomadura miaoliensis TaxID=430685 RepID=A0ABP7VC80_9ACTN
MPILISSTYHGQKADEEAYARTTGGAMHGAAGASVDRNSHWVTTFTLTHLSSRNDESVPLHGNMPFDADSRHAMPEGITAHPA